jgi:putative inorganic carbon (hco3(-)) transporter
VTAQGPARRLVPVTRLLGAASVGVLVAAGTVGSGAALANAPALTAALAVGGIAVGLLLRRPHVAVTLLAAASYFDAYLAPPGSGFVTPAKVIGLLAGAAWGYGWLSGRYPIVLRAPLLWVGALLLWLVPSAIAAWDQAAALEAFARYVMYGGLYFLVVQVVGDDRERAERMIDYLVIAAGVSAAMGLYLFSTGVVRLASGPVGDPNDYAFLLASALPLALYRMADRRRRLLAGVASVAIVLAVLASFSRGAILGLAVAGAWALLRGRVRLRGAVVAAIALTLIAVLGYQTQDGRVEEAFEGKTAVADSNVESRLTFWRVAVQQFESSPVVGVGPGNYSVRYPEHELPYVTPGRLDLGVTTHNTYLNVLAELGLPGLLFFLAFLAHSWLLIRRPTPDAGDRNYRTAVGAGLIVAATGAMFLTQQHYAPLWVLTALGALPAAAPRLVVAPEVERART